MEPPWTQPTASRGHYNGRSGSVHQNILTPKHASAQEVNRWRWQWVSGVYIGSRRPFCAIRVSVLSTETYNILCVSRECAHSPTGGAMALKGRFQNTAKKISELKWLESESWVKEFRWNEMSACHVTVHLAFQRFKQLRNWDWRLSCQFCFLHGASWKLVSVLHGHFIFIFKCRWQNWKTTHFPLTIERKRDM